MASCVLNRVTSVGGSLEERSVAGTWECHNAHRHGDLGVLSLTGFGHLTDLKVFDLPAS